MFQIYGSAGELLTSIPKTTTKGISRYKAYGWGETIGQGTVTHVPVSIRY